MAEEIVLGIKVNGSDSLASLKKEFKDLQKELEGTTAGSEKYLATLKKLGQVKDDIGDLQSTISALNPEGKVAAFQNVAGKLAGGFQAATGAAALFGGKAEEVEKALLKVQAASALAEGIKSVAGLSDAFAVLGTVLKANPIYAIAGVITGISAAVAVYYNKMKEATSETARLTKELEIQKKVTSEGTAVLERQIQIMEASGASEAKVLLVKKELIALKIEEIEASKKVQLEQLKEIQNNKTIFESLIAGLGFYSKANEAQKERAKEVLDLIKKSEQDILNLKTEYKVEEIKLEKKTIEEKEDLWKEAQAREADAMNMEIDRQEAENQLARDLFLELSAEQDEEDAERRKEKEDAENTEREALEQQQRQRMDQANKDFEESEREKTEAARVQQEARTQITNQGLNAAKALSDVFFQYQLNKAKGNADEELKVRKKMFQVDKAFSIARGIIDGIRSVQAAMTIPPPAGPILAGLNAAFAAATIAKIAMTQFNGGASSGDASTPALPSTGGGNVPSAPTPAPPRNDTTQLGREGQNLSQPIIIENRIVETEITERQNRVNRLKSQSSFG